MGFGKGKGGKTGKGKGKTLSAGKATSEWQQVRFDPAGNGRGSGVPPTPSSPWRTQPTQYTQAPWHQQQYQPHRNQYVHFQAHSGPDWVCQGCNTTHPSYHVFCAVCYQSPPRPPKKKQRRNRWDRSGRIRPKDIPEDALHADDVDEEMFDISTPEPPPQQQVDSVLSWLEDEGCDPNVIRIIQNHRQAKQPPPPPPKDMWAELRSAKDKVKHIEQQLTSAQARVDKAQSELDEANSVKDDLVDKHSMLLQQIDQAVAKLPHVDNLQSQVDHYASLFKRIQDFVAEGIPEERSQDRQRLYDLIFDRAPVETAPEADLQFEQHAGEDDGSSVVDKSGFGFGPAAKSPASSSPYSASRPASTVGSKPAASGDCHESKA